MHLFNSIPEIKASSPNQLRCQADGFTLVELLIVILIICLLALAAIQQYQQCRIQAKIAYALSSVDELRLDIIEYYSFYGNWPEHSQQLRHPITSREDNVIDRISLENGGAINIWLKDFQQFNVVNPVLTLRPALAGGDGPGVISWLCGKARVPKNTTVWGKDQSNIPDSFLIRSCK